MVEGATVEGVATATAAPRRFVLRRTLDVSGVSGIGAVAEGVQWSDGTAAVRWRGRWATTTVWDHGIDAILAVHGHQGATVIQWLDPQDSPEPIRTIEGGPGHERQR